jgi:hypothetical protein
MKPLLLAFACATVCLSIRTSRADHQLLMELICRENDDMWFAEPMEVQVHVGAFRARPKGDGTAEKLKEYTAQHPGDGRDCYRDVEGGETLIHAHEPILTFNLDDGEFVVVDVVIIEQDDRRLFDGAAILTGNAWSQWESGQKDPGETKWDFFLFMQHVGKGAYEEFLNKVGAPDDLIGSFRVRIEKQNGQISWTAQPGTDSGGGNVTPTRDDGTREADGRRLFHMTGSGVFSAHVLVQ